MKPRSFLPPTIALATEIVAGVAEDWRTLTSREGSRLKNLGVGGRAAWAAELTRDMESAARRGGTGGEGRG